MTNSTDRPYVDEVWVFVCIDPDGNEFVPTFRASNGTRGPLITTEPRHVENFRPMAEAIARAGQFRVDLVKFSGNRQTLETIR